MKHQSAHRYLLFAAMGITVIGCKEHVPPRPAGVPSSAVWAGGRDGGAFFLCTPSQNNEPNKCTVYDESTGEIYMSGEYILEGTERGAKAGELIYVAADGRRIYLRYDKTLSPVPNEGPTRRQ
jgi:hypothetical protein